MCGICGFFGAPDRRLLEAMTAAQIHRGPDDAGYYEGAEASLGFRRLSIIDLARGNQPMRTDDDLIHLVYNGEIYNYRELRAELSALGHAFHTDSDSEVGLHAYAEWGTDCFARFNGMWAMALVDRRGVRPSLVLARDHFGIKPLFYACWNGRLLFASEIKALLQDETFPREVDEQRLYEYLAFGLYDHSDDSFFRNVQKVPAASYLVIGDAGVEETRYWRPRLAEDASPDPTEFRTLFERAVERRLVADVPVGTCLSGGLDSSAVVTVMSRLLQARVPDAVSLGDHLKTFSAVFPGDPIDEKPYIDEVLAVSDAEPTFDQPTSDDFLDELEAWAWYADEPMISTAPYSMWSVMETARQSVTVLLDGQGGDELLAGYVPYQLVYLRQLLRERRFALLVREAICARDTVVPLVWRKMVDARRRVDVRDLIARDFAHRVRQPSDDRVQDDLKRRLLQDLTTYSLPSLLRYEDRNSMAHSLESRLPFLDQDLVEYILRLPAAAILRNGWSRAILRESLRGILPEKVRLRRKKIGFTTPEFRWLKAERAAFYSLMQSPSFQSRPYWNGPAVLEAFQAACNGLREESMFFWRTINVEIWLRLYFDDHLTAIDGESFRRGFAQRGDRIAARTLGSEPAMTLVEATRPNPGRQALTTGADGGVYARIPVRSRLIAPRDDLAAALQSSLEAAIGRGFELEDGDLVAVSEKVVAITQGRSTPVEQIRPGTAATLLSRFVSRVPVGIGLGRPATMQLAIEEAGLARIVLAAAAAALTRPLGLRGVFYRVAGARVSSIDGPTPHTMPPYNTHASKAPSDPDGVAARLASVIGDRFGRRVEVAIVDANDLGALVLGSSPNADATLVVSLLTDNPLGQTDEQTPFAVLRRVGALSILKNSTQDALRDVVELPH